MCRNIRPLFNFDPPATDQEIRAASLQFVRKISGFHQPSKTNERSFMVAVDEIAHASARFLSSLETIERLDARLCLSGHGKPFIDAQGHIDGSRALVAERLEAKRQP